MVAGSLLLGMQSGPSALTGGATAGTVLGLGSSGLLLALNRKPLFVMAALLVVAPRACVPGALIGFAPLGLAPGALAALVTAWLAIYPKGRAVLTSDISTCAVIVYALLVRVVRPGVAPLEPLLPERSAALRWSLNIPENATVLVYPGLLTTVSRHLEVLQALLLLANRYLSLHVVLAHEELVPLEASSDALVGATPTQSRTRQLEERLRQTLGTIDSRVTWIGACSDLGEVLSLGDVVVMPLTAAPSIRTLLLAMASGKPIVAARTETVEEQLAGA